MVVSAPASIAAARAERPMVPPPSTSTVSPGLTFSLIDRSDSDREGLDHGGLFIGYVVGYPVQLGLRGGDELAEGPGPLLHAQHDLVGAEVGISCQTVVAAAAHALWVDGNSVSYGEAPHLGAHCHDIPGHLVALDGGRAPEGVGAVVGVHIGAADAGGDHPDLDLVSVPVRAQGLPRSLSCSSPGERLLSFCSPDSNRGYWLPAAGNRRITP